MKHNFAFVITTLVFGLISCSSPQNNMSTEKTLWVSGFKTEASAGAGKAQVLKIHRGDNLDNPNWETFYAPIVGFQFEEGVMQKIVVREKHLDETDLPADASSIQYTLVKVEEKQKDLRTELNGAWTLVWLNDSLLNRMVVVPTMTINLFKSVISGSDGCNSYSGKIKELTASKIDIKTVAVNNKMCVKRNVAPGFFDALGSIKTYHIKGNTVTFSDEKGNKILSFLKNTDSTVEPQLNGLWIATIIQGKEIDKKYVTPQLEINISEMRVSGTNGCNNFTGSIKNFDSAILDLGPLATTEKLCAKMERADSFDQAILRVAEYKIQGLSLTLYDKESNSLIEFKKSE